MISKITIGLVSSDDELIRFFGFKKDTLFSEPLSSGYFKSKGIKPVPVVYTFNPNKNDKNFYEFVKGKTEGQEAFLLLVDQNQEKLVSEIRNSAFCYVFENFSNAKNRLNFSKQIVALIIKKFGIVLQKMEDSTATQLISLPIRNFRAKELDELVSIFRSGCHIGDFSSQIDSKVNLLINRRRPIPRQGKSTKKDIKIIDDKNNQFEYGHEKHARMETGDPHTTSCYLSGSFRFGKSIERLRHYNVDKAGSHCISGVFLDCHNSEHTLNASSCTHINMFSNDFMEYNVK